MKSALTVLLLLSLTMANLGCRFALKDFESKIGSVETELNK